MTANWQHALNQIPYKKAYKMLKLSTFETEIDKYQVFMPSYKQQGKSIQNLNT